MFSSLTKNQLEYALFTLSLVAAFWQPSQTLPSASANHCN